MNTCTNEAALNTVFDCTYYAILIPQNLKPIKATQLKQGGLESTSRVKTPLSIDFWVLSLSWVPHTFEMNWIWMETCKRVHRLRPGSFYIKGVRVKLLKRDLPLFLFFKYSSVKKRRDFRACWSQLGHQNQMGYLLQSSRFWSISLYLQRFKGVVWNFGFKYHKYTERAQTFITTLHEFG